MSEGLQFLISSYIFSMQILQFKLHYLPPLPILTNFIFFNILTMLTKFNLKTDLNTKL